MALFELVIMEKRRRKALRRKAKLKARRRSKSSAMVGCERARKRLSRYELQRRQDAFEAQQRRSAAAVKAANKAKRGGFLDSVKLGLRKLLPRRSGGAD